VSSICQRQQDRLARCDARGLGAEMVRLSGFAVARFEDVTSHSAEIFDSRCNAAEQRLG